MFICSHFLVQVPFGVCCAKSNNRLIVSFMIPNLVHGLFFVAENTCVNAKRCERFSGRSLRGFQWNLRRPLKLGEPTVWAVTKCLCLNYFFFSFHKLCPKCFEKKHHAVSTWTCDCHLLGRSAKIKIHKGKCRLYFRHLWENSSISFCHKLKG